MRTGWKHLWLFPVETCEGLWTFCRAPIRPLGKWQRRPCTPARGTCSSQTSPTLSPGCRTKTSPQPTETLRRWRLWRRWHYTISWQRLVSADFPSSVWIRLLTKIAEIENRLSGGTNEKIQPSSLTAAFQVTRALIVTEAQMLTEDHLLWFWGPAVTREQGTWLRDGLPPGVRWWSHKHAQSWRILVPGTGEQMYKKYLVCGCLEQRCTKQF